MKVNVKVNHPHILLRGVELLEQAAKDARKAISMIESAVHVKEAEKMAGVDLAPWSGEADTDK